MYDSGDVGAESSLWAASSELCLRVLNAADEEPRPYEEMVEVRNELECTELDESVTDCC